MADPFEPPRLSATSRVLLAALVLINVVVFLFSITESPHGAGRGTVEAGSATGGTLLMIDELSDADRAERRAARVERTWPMPEASLSEPELLPGCRVWGPFTGDAPLQQARAVLLAVTDSVQIVAGQMQAAPDYLVYLGTDDNPDNARRLMQELESQEIDAYVIAGGPFLNSVSAGVFSNRARAEQLVKKLDDLGYDPQLETLQRVQDVWYLAARVPEDFQLDGISSVSCQVFAPAGEFL